MFLVDLIAALVIGGLLTWLFVSLFDRPGPWGIGWVFLLIVVLGAWVGGLWIAPFGPVWLGISWLPIAIVGFFFALLLAAATPVRPYRPRTGTGAGAEEAMDAGVAVFSAFLWIFIIGLLAAAIAAYL